MLFSVMTGKFQLNLNFNLNWKISTKGLVTFKRWDEVNDKNWNIMGVHWKIRFFSFFFDGGGTGGGGRGWGGESPKKGGLDILQI